MITTNGWYEWVRPKIWGKRVLQKSKKTWEKRVFQKANKKDLRERVLLHPFSVKVSHCLLTKKA